MSRLDVRFFIKVAQVGHYAHRCNISRYHVPLVTIFIESLSQHIADLAERNLSIYSMQLRLRVQKSVPGSRVEMPDGPGCPDGCHDSRENACPGGMIDATDNLSNGKECNTSSYNG